MTAVPLGRQTLNELPASVGRPAYALDGRSPGIVHLGFGGFHRAHMARYTHDLMQVRADARGWAIVGAGFLPVDTQVHAALAPQHALYTLVERSADADVATVIGSVCETLYAGESSAALLDRIDQARIVSITVTEAGYNLNAASKRLDTTLAAVARDLAAPRAPLTPVGVICEGLRRRMSAGRQPFTALSCDNIQHNGAVLRQAVLDYAQRVDPRLASWIETHGRFPSTMVDRITPVASPKDAAFVANAFGVDDRWPIICEDFRQWVIEDDFVDGRPDWDRVGAQFVQDVAPYEFMKLRLLNTSHLAIAGLGRLMGYAYVHEAMGDWRLQRYMQALMDRETGPTLKPVPGVDLPAYKAELIKRFANPQILDTVERVNTDAPLNYLLDPIRDRLASGDSVDLLALGLAAWMRRVRGEDEGGAPILVRHPLAQTLRERAIEGEADPGPLFALKTLFGDMGNHPGLATATGQRLDELYTLGAARTLEKALLGLAA